MNKIATRTTREIIRNNLLPYNEIVHIKPDVAMNILKVIDRRFTPLEAYMLRRIDMATRSQRNLHAYARLFDWEVDEVREFFDQYKIFRGGFGDAKLF